MATTYTLEDIYAFSDDYIKKLLTRKGFNSKSFLSDRLKATSVMYNDGFIIDSDTKCVTDRLFKLLYKYNDDDLKFIAQYNGIRTNVDRIGLIRKIIDKYNTYDENNLYGLLLDAIDFGYIKIATLLLIKGANVNTRYNAGKPVILLAIKSRNKEMVKLLLDYGSNIEATTDKGTNALSKAVSLRDKEMVKLLLDRGAKVDSQNHKAIKISAEMGDNDTIEILLQYGEDVNADNSVVLEVAVQNMKMHTMYLFLQKGTKITEEIMKLALKIGNEEIIELLKDDKK